VTNQRPPHDWTFLSNHSHVLYCISCWPDIRIRDIAVKVRITERAVQRIVVDLERGGYLKRERVGRQNHYRLEPRLHLRHPLLHNVEIGRLLAILQPGTAACEMSVQNPQDSAVVTERGLNAVPSRANGKAILRLKREPRKPSKLTAKKSVRLARSS
jgi:DNA-binding Lrp family transcriptional regulator